MIIPLVRGVAMSTQELPVNATIAALHTKRDVVEYLRSKEHQTSWTAFVTGMVFGWCLGIGRDLM